MYLRSLQKELYNNGSTVIGTNEESLKEFNQKISDLIEKGSCQTRAKFKNKLLVGL